MSRNRFTRQISYNGHTGDEPRSLRWLISLSYGTVDVRWYRWSVWSYWMITSHTLQLISHWSMINGRKKSQHTDHICACAVTLWLTIFQQSILNISHHIQLHRDVISFCVRYLATSVPPHKHRRRWWMVLTWLNGANVLVPRATDITGSLDCHAREAGDLVSGSDTAHLLHLVPDLSKVVPVLN
jgi:hypothetical protein